MRFRFTIRDLLWLTLVVAMGVAWWIDHRSLNLRNRFTVMTVDSTDRGPLPSVLKDNETGEILVTDTDKWKRGRLVPDAAPAKQTPNNQ